MFLRKPCCGLDYIHRSRLHAEGKNVKTSICQDQNSHHFCCGLDEAALKKRHEVKMLCEAKGSSACRCS